MKNYHTHTMRCHHALNTEEEYIQTAIKAGFQELGFSDHTPWHYDSSFQPTMRMSEKQFPEYVETLRKYKEKYKDQISIKIGLECEYFETKMPWLLEKVKDYELDYLILGQHYDESDETGIYFGRPLSKKLFTKYVNSCIKGLEMGVFSYLAHPDLAGYDIDDPFYKEEMTRLCLKAKELDIPLEFNLLGFMSFRHYPNEVFFKIASEIGNKVIIGFDAHESCRLADMKTYHRAQMYLNSLSIEITEEIRFLR